MKPLRIIGIALGALVGVLLIGGLALSDRFEAERSIVVAAPPALAYAHVADLTKHAAWNAWKARDATMTFSFPTARTAGAGAIYEWTSAEHGSGSLTIAKAREPQWIETVVVLAGRGRGRGWWRFAPEGAGTRVTRRFRGEIPVPVLGPWLVLIVDPAADLAASMDEGLALYKRAVEAAAAAP